MVEGKVPKRILKDLNDIVTDNPIEGVTVEPDPTNALKWIVLLTGPKGSPYEGGKFKVSFLFPEGYPFKPPKVQFETKIYNPHVMQKTGEVCTELYENGWVPTRKASSIVQTFLSIMMDPRADGAIEAEIAQELTNNRELFLKKAMEWTKNYAK